MFHIFVNHIDGVKGDVNACGMRTHHGNLQALCSAYAYALWFVHDPCFWNSRNISYSSKMDGAVGHSSKSRGVARLFKMRGRQGGLRGDWPKWRLSVDPVHSVISFGGLKGGWASDWGGSRPPAPAGYAPEQIKRPVPLLINIDVTRPLL